ncbi:MAG: class I SAM-dependent methyltransferase [Promethearchaeota archaeon]
MKNKELLDFLISEAEYPFSGWDFSHIQDRIVNAPLTWSYLSKILPLVRSVNSLLDMGTGGGEFLASLAPLPKHTYATEGYKPNVQIARNQLEPFGVEVYFCPDKDKLPFQDEEFGLVINRHEEYSPDEVYRIIKPGGNFMTQQVGDKSDSKLRFILTGKEDSNDGIVWDLDHAIKELIAVGFEIIESYEDMTLTRIYDIGAIAYYFKAVPWELPDFSVRKYYDKLVELNEYIIKNGYLDLENNNHRFIIKAKKA